MSRSLRDRFDAVLLLLPLAAEHYQDDPEYVHLLRVWTRRTVTALKLFRDFFREKVFRKTIKRLNEIRSVANTARDCDVLMVKLRKSIKKNRQRSSRSRSPAEKLSPMTESNLRWLTSTQKQRIKCQQDVLEIYQKLCQDNQLSLLFKKLLDPDHSFARNHNKKLEIDFQSWAKMKLHTLVKDFLQSVPNDTKSPSKLHRFRILAKKLRYSIELLAAPLPADLVDEVYLRTTSIQNQLGRVNDLSVFCEKLDSKFSKARKNSRRKQWGKLKKKHERQLKLAILRCPNTLDMSCFLRFEKSLRNLIVPTEFCSKDRPAT